jgi:sphingomyelin phosphodiesterase
MLMLVKSALIFSFFAACKASAVGDIIAALEKAVDCDSCHSLLEVFKNVAVLGDSVFSSALVDVCKATGVIIHYFHRLDLI